MFLCKVCAIALKPRTDVPWNDLRLGAAWRKHLKTREDFCSEYSSHKLFTIPGLNPLAIALDTLHTWDLGISCHLLGSFLWDLVEDGEAGSRDTRWKRIYDEIQSIYDTLNVAASQRIGRLRWIDVAKSNQVFPVLKHVKGRRVRHFVPVCLSLAEQYKETCLQCVMLQFVVSSACCCYRMVCGTLKVHVRTRVLIPSIGSWPLKLWQKCMHLGCQV